MKRFFWSISNLFGYLFGWRFLSPFYHAVINLSLHGLGYDNARSDSLTGEKWFIEKILSAKNPEVCLDIGANVGNYTRLLLKYTKAKIYAIEPSASSFKKLCELESERVVKIKTAISDFDGESFLYSKIGEDQKSSLDNKINTGKIKEKVSVMTVQSAAKKYGITKIDFIKIDTEGYEAEVLKGLGDLRPTLIQFEFNIHHLYRNQTLLGLTKLLPGYEFYRLLPREMIKINPEKFLDNIFMFSNIVAMKV